MTNSVVSQENVAPTATREPRPFLFLEPMRATTNDITFPAEDVQGLDAYAADSVPVFVRSLVNFTIGLQNRRALEHGKVPSMPISVLNRRRRAARAWLNAIVTAKVDAATRHAVATQWIPTLTGTGPDLSRCVGPASSIFEFVRGCVTASLFEDAADNLLPHAKALHVLEGVLAVHLAAVRDAGRSTQPIRS